MTLAPRAVVVHRLSELDRLLHRHGSRGQAEFFLRSRGRDLAPVQHRHDALDRAVQQVAASIPGHWRRLTVERADLPRTRFDPEDVVIAVGPDGLVANVAKYLDGQPVVGVNPEPGQQPGVLVQHEPGRAGQALIAVESGVARLESRCMVQAVLDDGQQLRALNEIYAGDPGHQSARYRLGLVSAGASEGTSEPQSSSGVVIGTGTGATGWCSSLASDRPGAVRLPGPADRELAWFVREAWPSATTSRTLVAGRLADQEQLTLVAESDLVVFGDGMETDRLHQTWGQRLTLQAAPQHLTLVASADHDQTTGRTPTISADQERNSMISGRRARRRR